MDETDHTNETTHAPPQEYNSATDFSPPVLVPDRYMSAISDLDIEENTQREFLETLWNILVTIADLNLGIDPVQMLFAEHIECSSDHSADAVNLSSEPIRESINVTATFKDQNAVLEES